jgi:hypothetical protein
MISSRGEVPGPDRSQSLATLAFNSAHGLNQGYIRGFAGDDDLRSNIKGDFLSSNPSLSAIYGPKIYDILIS